MNPSSAAHENVEETRIALTFTGGVALAVYESGVALEFFRLVSDPAYASLRKQLGRVVVDVISGTSAGGLNGAFLANALVNQGDIWQLLPLWRDKADFDRLLYPPSKVDPQSLLDGDFFRDEILNALQAKGSGAAGKAALQDSMDLYITGTNLDGHRVDFDTPDGEDIATRTYRQVFRFQYRHDGQDDKNNRNDFRGDANIQRLALAARTTASFPVAFAPVLIEESFMGPVAQNLAETAKSYHIDGGVLDNKPIDLALKAIDERSARKRVTRLLFYIEPDPDVIRVRAAEAGPQPYTPVEVAYKALIDLPGFQSITNALQELKQRNHNVAQRRRALDYYNRMAGAYQFSECWKEGLGDDPVSQIEADAGLTTHSLGHRDAFKYAGPARFDSAFYRAMEDGYLDLRLQSLDRLQPGAARSVSRCFEEIMAALVLPLEDEAKSAVHVLEQNRPDPATAAAVVSTGAAATLWPLRYAIYQIKSLIVAHLDVQYYRRYYDYLTGAVLKHYPVRPTGIGTGSGAGDNETTFYMDAAESLNQLVQRCCDQLDSLRELERANVGPHANECVHLAELLQAAHENIVALARSYEQVKDEERRSLAGRDAFAGLLRGLLSKIERRPLQQDRCNLFNDMRRTDWEKLKNAILGVLQKHRPEKPVPGREPTRQAKYIGDLIRGYWSLRDAMQSFYMRDVMLYPMMQGDGLQTELVEIRFARISPADADVFRKGLSASDKLAGEVLWHFGGFLKESWRGTDLVWGRLDAAEIIVKNLLPDDQWESIGRPLVQKLQADIVAEMMQDYGMGIFEPASSTAIKDLIGKQTASAIPASDRFRWSLEGALTIAKIVRKGVANSAIGKLVPGKLANAVNVGFQWATWIVILITKACKLSWPWLLGLGLITAAVVTAVLVFRPWRWFGSE